MNYAINKKPIFITNDSIFGGVNMKTIRKAISAIMTIALCLFFLSSYSHAFQNEPWGFKGHEWGSEFKRFGEMTLITGDPDVEGYIGLANIKAYSQKNDELRIEDVPVLLIAYYFYNDKLGMVSINFETKQNYKKLNEILVSRHGKGSENNPYYDQIYETYSGKKPPSFREMHWWKGKLGYIRLEYNDKLKRGTILYDYWNAIFKDDFEKGVRAFDRKDYKKAMKYFLNFADSGIWTWFPSQAQGYIGYMYEKALGVDKDCEQAILWYRKATAVNNPFGQARLAYMYYIGCGVEKDYHKAFELYRKAAEQGYAPAQYDLGLTYEEGAGVEKNIEKAKFWYKKASDQGHPFAKKALKRLNADQ